MSAPDPMEGTESWEERALLQARFFNVHRFKHQRRDIIEQLSFPGALVAIGEAQREGYTVLLYVVTRANMVVCLPIKRINRFIELWAAEYNKKKG